MTQLRSVVLWTLGLLVVLSGCLGGPETLQESQPIAVNTNTREGSGPTLDAGAGNVDAATSGASSSCRTVTLHGAVYHNDLRGSGRFAARRGPGGTPGARDPWTETPTLAAPPVNGDNRNYLGLWDATVEVYEVDSLDQATSGCYPTALVGSTTVLHDGSFTWTGEVCDPCQGDSDGAGTGTVSLAALVVLRYCDPAERCFSVRNSALSIPSGDHYTGSILGPEPPYSHWYRYASNTAPLLVRSASTVYLRGDYFQSTEGETQGDPADLKAQAASVFAAMVDVTRVVHHIEGVPFPYSDQGEVRALWPSLIGNGGGGHSHQPLDGLGSRLCIEAPRIDRSQATYDPMQPERWVEGNDPPVAHEYGHLLHYWQWDDAGKWVSYGYNGSGEEDLEGEEYPITAFKEGWAEFIADVTYDGTEGSDRRCDRVDDLTPIGNATTLGPEGRRIARDVEQVLCNLWDNRSNSRNYSGTYYWDNVDLTLPEMVTNLQTLWLGAGAATWNEVLLASRSARVTDPPSPLGLCAYATTWTGSHAGTTNAWRTTLNVSGITCPGL